MGRVAARQLAARVQVALLGTPSRCVYWRLTGHRCILVGKTLALTEPFVHPPIGTRPDRWLLRTVAKPRQVHGMQADLLLWLSTHLIQLGLGVLLVVCLLETAVFAGLILPVGALIGFSAMLASRGFFDPVEVAAVACFGALVGDQIGFLIGRSFGRQARPSRGAIARIWRRALSQTEALVFGRGLVGIPLSRAVPFVRTIMPWFAGRSGVGWGRFLLLDAAGVLLWGAIYVGGGLLAGAGWQQIAGHYGELAGAAILALAVVVLVLLTGRWVGRAGRKSRRRRQDRRPRRSPVGSTGTPRT